MLRDDTKKWAVELLVAEIKKVPLGSWSCMEELIEASEGIEKAKDGRFDLIGRNASFSFEDLNVIETEVFSKAEEGRLYIDSSFEAGFRVYEKIKPGTTMDYSTLRKMSYSPFTYLGGSDDYGFFLDGRTLTETKRFAEDSTMRSIELTDEQFEVLCDALENARIESWDEDYFAPVLDGTTRNLLMLFKDNKIYTCHGSNAWPDSYDTIAGAVDCILDEAEEPEDNYEDDMSEQSLAIAKRALKALAKFA